MRSILCLLLSTVLAISLTVASNCLAAVPATASSQSSSHDAHGVTLSLVADRADVRAGETVRVTATVSNQGSDTVYLTYSVPDVALGIVATREDGRPVRPTDLMEHPSNSYLRTDSGRRITLKPGQHVSYTVTVTACFDLTQPGTYIIEARNRAYVAGIEGGIPLQDEVRVKVDRSEHGYGNPEPTPGR